MNPIQRRENARKPRHASDFYETKLGAAIAHVHSLLSYLGHKEDSKFLDLGVGNGIYGKALVECGVPVKNIFGIEVNSEAPLAHKDCYANIAFGDFMEHDFGDTKFTYVLGNPPYRDIMETTLRAYELLEPDGAVSFLTKQTFLATIKRHKAIFSQLNICRVAQFVRRPINANHADDYIYTVIQNSSKWTCYMKWLDWSEDGSYELT